jgi:hypothetical protein
MAKEGVMTEAAHEDENGKRRWYKRPWFSFAGILMLLMGVLAYVCLLDGAPPQDADLLPDAVAGTDATNPLMVLCNDIGTGVRNSFGSLPLEVQDFRTGQEVALKSFVEAHERERTLLLRFISTDSATWAWPPSDEPARGAAGAGDVFGAVPLLQAHAVLLARSGRSAEATEEALAMVRLGHLLHLVHGEGYEMTRALAVQRWGETLLQECLRDSRDDLLFKRAQDVLAVSGPSIKAWIAAEKGFYRAIKGMVKRLDENDPEEWRRFGDASKRAYLFRPNRTLHIYAQRLRPMLAGLENDWLSGLKAMERSSRESSQAGWGQWIDAVTMNLLGASRINEFWRYKPGSHMDVVPVVAYHRMTLVVVALRRHELAKGRLPVKLEELVPEFLVQVPSDPYSNRPFCWDSIKRVLYSVGANGVDEGGDETLEAYPGLPLRELHMPEAFRDVVVKYQFGP